MSDSAGPQPASTPARWRFRLPSWGGSLLFHLLVLLVLTVFFNMARKPQAEPGEPVRVASIVFKETLSDDSRMYTDADSNVTTTSDVTATKSVEEMLEERFAEEPLTDAAELPEAIGVGVPQTVPSHFGQLNTGIRFAGADTGTGAGPPGGQSRVRFFNTEGTANRFIFVIDRSGSMSDAGGKPFRAAKRQLAQSIDSLKETNSFNIIFYNETSTGLFPTLYPATALNKTQAKNYIDLLRPLGGTEHEGALVKALRQKPEVVFFLTDGDENDAIRPAGLDRIARLNTVAARINVVQFGGGPGAGSPFLHQLARENDGQFQYVNIQSF